MLMIYNDNNNNDDDDIDNNKWVLLSKRDTLYF